jgi:hypothetical protein
MHQILINTCCIETASRLKIAYLDLLDEFCCDLLAVKFFRRNNKSVILVSYKEIYRNINTVPRSCVLPFNEIVQK